jgi:hypothetical protein
VNRPLEVGIVLSLAFFGPREVHGKQAGQQSRPHITVVVCDQVRITPETWLMAKQQSIRILDNAGVDVVWIDAAAKSCMAQSLDAYFVVVVSPKAPKGRIAFGTMGFALGATFSSGTIVTVWSCSHGLLRPLFIRGAECAVAAQPAGKRRSNTAVRIPRVANRNPDQAAELPRKASPPAQIYFFLVSLPFFAVVSADCFDADSFAAR